MLNQHNSEKMHYLIGQRILKKRKEQGYTGAQLAQLLGVSQQQISRYERGKNRVDFLYLFKISIILKTTMHWFLEDITIQLEQFLQKEESEIEILSYQPRRHLKNYDEIQWWADTTL